MKTATATMTTTKAEMPKIDKQERLSSGEALRRPFLTGTIFPFVLSNATQLLKATKARRRRQRGTAWGAGLWAPCQG